MSKEIGNTGIVFDKTINLGNLLTMVGMFVTTFMFIGGGWLYLQKRVDDNSREIALNSQKINMVQTELTRDRLELRHSLNDLKVEIRRLSDKIDDKADK